MVLRGITPNPIQGYGVIKNQVSEEPTVLFAPRRVPGEVESIPLEVLPKKLRRQWMVRCSVLGAAVRALEGPTDRIARLWMTKLHGSPETLGCY